MRSELQEPGPSARLAGLLDAGAGDAAYRLASEIFPISRSITGPGVRETLAVLARHIPLELRHVPSGTAVFDWTIPREWHVREAHITAPDGRRVVDFADCNLHVVGYSTPVRMRLPLAELKAHIFTLADQPCLVPYRTSYYAETWGFCMSQDSLDALEDGEYEVLIDSSLYDGVLTYGEYLHRGTTEEEVLLSAHICHPSLANDNCSGLAALTILAAAMRGVRTRLSYRFLFAPGTIGAIAWLAANPQQVHHIKHGLVVSCLGDAGGPTYKRTRQGSAPIDRAMAHVLRHNAPTARVLDFSPYGYDERQYCSPGFNLAVGSLQRSQWGTFPEYHTSADNLSFIRPEHLAHSLDIIITALDVLENDRTLVSTNPYCEPQLGRRGLYSLVGGGKDGAARSMAMLWAMNLSDGRNSLLDVAERSGLAFASIREAASLLERHGLLRAG